MTDPVAPDYKGAIEAIQQYFYDMQRGVAPALLLDGVPEALAAILQSIESLIADISITLRDYGIAPRYWRADEATTGASMTDYED